MSDDSFHIASDSSSSEGEILPKKIRQRNGKLISNSSRLAGKRAMQRTNHDDFFKNVEGHSDSSEPKNKSLESIVDDGSSDENPIQSTSVHRSESATVIENDSMHSMLLRKLEDISHEMAELKAAMMSMKRQIVKVEVLIKCRRENNYSETDVDFLNTLKSYGLPLTAKEKLDDLEKKLKDENEKTKLVCLKNSIAIVHVRMYGKIFHIHSTYFNPGTCFGQNKR